MIHFFTEDISFDTSTLLHIPDWLDSVAHTEGFNITAINYIFCSDAYLLQINNTYLNHDYYTDIITFDNRETEYSLEGDIFISIERVQENCALQQTSFFSELLRVVVHGLLHLVGYDDHDNIHNQQMRKIEDKYLDLYFQTREHKQ